MPILECQRHFPDLQPLDVLDSKTPKVHPFLHWISTVEGPRFLDHTSQSSGPRRPTRHRPAVQVPCGAALCYCLPAEAVDHGRHNALVGLCLRIGSVAMHILRQCTEDPTEHHITMPGEQERASAGDSWAFLNTEFRTFQNIYPIYACPCTF